jgi:NADP-dependent 3-hydroxy acid dehydrogenase YdfG
MTLKQIVITGASGGIGAALAVRLGQAGHRVALAARREAELREVAARAGSGAVAVATDVTKRSEAERLSDRAIAELGHVDVWVSNAGRGITRPVLVLTDEDLDQIDTNPQQAAVALEYFKDVGAFERQAAAWRPSLPGI